MASHSYNEPRARHVTVTDSDLRVELTDGRTISVPLEWYPRLSHSTPEERKNYRLIGYGTGIHWHDLDEDISVKNLALGIQIHSRETQYSLGQWLKRRGQL